MMLRLFKIVVHFFQVTVGWCTLKLQCRFLPVEKLVKKLVTAPQAHQHLISVYKNAYWSTMVGNTEAEHWSVITKLFIWFLNHVSRAEKKRGEEYLWDHMGPNLRIRLDCAVLVWDRWCVVWDKTHMWQQEAWISWVQLCLCTKEDLLFISQENGLNSHDDTIISQPLLILSDDHDKCVTHQLSLDLIGNCTAVHLQPDVASLSMIVHDLWEGLRTPPAGSCLWM